MKVSLSRAGLLLLCGSFVVLSGTRRPEQKPADRSHPLATEEDYHRAMRELSNWGRWGKEDELGAANLVTPAKRKQALALAKEGVTISLAHDVLQETAPDSSVKADRTPITVGPNGGSDKYSLTGSYHGYSFSHLDSLECHELYEGKGYNGLPMEEIKAAGGCPKGSINALKDGITTRAVLFDATLLPGKATGGGWLELGTAVHREDLETLERIEHVRVQPGDIILLNTGRWKRRSALGPWTLPQDGLAGFHADVAYFLKERDVSFIGSDGISDVYPTGFPRSIGSPLHHLAIVALGVTIFDALDLERAVAMSKKLNRWEFLFTAAPIRVEMATGSLVNPLAIF
jgi:kynurenine formamidase